MFLNLTEFLYDGEFMGKKSKRQVRKVTPRWLREQKLFEHSKKYPNCVGTYPDCPDKIEDPNNPPEQCKKCPMYKLR